MTENYLDKNENALPKAKGNFRNALSNKNQKKSWQSKIIKIVLLTDAKSCKNKMVRERQWKGWADGREERKKIKRVKTQSKVRLYSPRRMGYRTLFYAAFFCAYACCLSSGTIQPARVPSHGLVGSRTSLEKSRVGSNFQLLRVALFLDLGCDPSVCIPPSIFYQMVGAPQSDCHSCDW